MIACDSGAHSIFKEYIRKNPAKGKDFFESDVFWKYVDDYAEFIKKHKDEFEFYVSVDVVYNPELSWKVQKYLEDTHKLNPLPVFHCYEDFKWLKKYIDNYDYIGLGGLAGKVGKKTWIGAMGDPIFDLICDTPDRMPRVKVHGFAMASPELFSKWPFYSIDSASWVIYGRYGGVIVPKKVKGEYNYTIAPWILKTSWRNHHINIPGTHIDNITHLQKKEIVNYFNEKGYGLGVSKRKKVKLGYVLAENEQWIDMRKRDEVEIIVEKGVCNYHKVRDDLNLYYFLDMEKSVPEWPWPWKNRTRRIFI